MPEAILINGEISIIKTPEDIFNESRDSITRARNWYLDAVHMEYSNTEIELRKQNYISLVTERDAKLLEYTSITGKGGFTFSK